MTETKTLRKYAQLEWFLEDLQGLALQPSIPLHVVGILVVPNLQPLQKATIPKVYGKLV